MAKISKIDEVYRPLLDGLPAALLEECDPCILDPTTLPTPPKRFATDRIICQRGWHFYGSSYRVDAVQFFAPRDMYRILGLWILSVLVHRETARSRLDLSHPLCDVTTLIARGGEQDEAPGEEFASLAYAPALVDRHPFPGDAGDVWDLPCFTLTNDNELIETEEDYAERHRIVGFGHALGASRLALLLLDLGRPDNMTLEIDLEEEAGYRGVSPTSAEARFALPGSDAWAAIADTAPDFG